ncbi:hypothetical protein V496_02558 [Pseudogymnoascus sp. VKM F-4515 (FW-2607)]|nr:hypothetical protein V496_02558 [Pseudogymnoascus sp. VKM F-4515 (FW-2607)]
MSNPGLTGDELVELLSMARKTFSDDYIQLHDKKIAAIKNCAALVAIDPTTIRRNVPRKRAHTILTDIWRDLPEVFVLCSVAITIARLGQLKSTDYIRQLREWWDKADRPDGLKETVKRLADILPSHTKQDEVATFENAVLLAAKSIPDSKDREAWIESCLSNVDSLKQLTSSICGSGRKRKSAAVQQAGPDTLDGHNRLIRARSIESVEPAATISLHVGNASSLDPSLCQSSTELTPFQLMARMAEVDKLGIIGNYLFGGINASLMRRKEMDDNIISFTDTVRLHIAYQAGEDFKLEVCLSSSVGQTILQAMKGSIEDLRSMFGDYLFGAIEESNCSMERGVTAAKYM